MKTICSFDNVACLIDGMPDTFGQLGLILICCIAFSAIFVTLTYRKL